MIPASSVLSAIVIGEGRSINLPSTPEVLINRMAIFSSIKEDLRLFDDI